MAEDGYEHEHAWARRYTKRFQPHGEDTGGSSIFFKDSDQNEAMEVGPYCPSNGMEDERRAGSQGKEEAQDWCHEDRRY